MTWVFIKSLRFCFGLIETVLSCFATRSFKNRSSMLKHLFFVSLEVFEALLGTESVHSEYNQVKSTVLKPQVMARCSLLGQSCVPLCGCCDPSATCHCRFFNAICFCRRVEQARMCPPLPN
uniref:Agouti domain-containing protein n=1 Tax=Poecilia latipinna TaxID=48699 RepID=A0A3B3VD41_9TELE